MLKLTGAILNIFILLYYEDYKPKKDYEKSINPNRSALGLFQAERLGDLKLSFRLTRSSRIQ